ncbi:hypothetical protein OAX78_03840, partial [Planctomycetota bacterium]|nr:hypothetical protein [Planctomycetota bacterium]
EHWTHGAHLTVALWYAHEQRADAYTRLRSGIKRYNAASGLVETPTRGYHETITQAWFHLVLHFLDVYDAGQPLQDLADEVTQVYGRNDLFAYYSRELLFGADARARWIAPDVAELPALEPHTPQDRRWLQGLTIGVARERQGALARAA